MRGLSRRPRWARLRGRHGERGGIAVATALLLPIFLGLAALAVDTAGVWAARQQVVNGADAAVLAVALDCANGRCGDIKTTSEDYFFANNEAAKLADLKVGAGWIYVDGRQVRTTGTWEIRHFFAGALGYPTGELSVESTAAWAPADRAVTASPVAISFCEYEWNRLLNGRSSSSVSIPLTPDTTGNCGSRNGVTMTGGSAPVAPTSGRSCGTSSQIGTALTEVATLPSACTGAYLSALVGQTVWIPVWDRQTVTGSTRTYRVVGYTGFEVTRITSGSAPALVGRYVVDARYADTSTPPATTAPDLGARVVYLTDPSTWTGANCRNGATTC